jgi:nitrite reductase/ring-hydroxylating ferredoxin subunit
VSTSYAVDATRDDEFESDHVVVPVSLASGVGGKNECQPLYEATIAGEIHVLWELEDGRVACAPAVCPHKPALGALLHKRGVVQGSDLRCMRHANLYSGSTGECVDAEGAGSPGQLAVCFGERVDDHFIIEMPK